MVDCGLGVAGLFAQRLGLRAVLAGHRELRTWEELGAEEVGEEVDVGAI